MKNLLEFFPSARPKSPTEFCSPCPSCGGNDRFLIWPQRGDTGRYHCRQCGIGGDAIDFLRTFEGMSYPEACKALGVPTKDRRGVHYGTASPKPVARPKEQQSIMPPEAWTTAATAFLADCQSELLKNPEAAEVVHAQRYIGERAAFSGGLGWHSRDEYFTRKGWSVPTLQGREKMIVPRGLVIATRRDGNVIGLTVRCTSDRPQGRPKYWQVAGSGQAPFIVGEVGQAVVLLESALDAVLVRQESQNTVAAVGMMGSTKSLDQATADFIRQAPSIIACPDNDEAGHKAWERWREEFPKATRITPVGVKDLGDMHALATAQHMRGEQGTAPYVSEWLRIALEIA